MIEYFLAAFGCIIWLGVAVVSSGACFTGLINFFEDDWQNNIARNSAYVVGGLMGLTVTTGLVIAMLSMNTSTHGSCKYEHWAGKAYVCDEYYPPPIKENPNG